MANELINFESLQKTLQDFAVDIRDRYKDVLKNNGHFTQYSHQLYDSITTRLEVNGTSYQVKMDLLDYWKYVENDTKPHFPPPSAILQWIQVKPIIPRPNEKGITPTNNQLAYLIGRKIATEGTTGTHDLEKSKEDVLAWYKDKIEEALGHDMENYIRKLVYFND